MNQPPRALPPRDRRREMRRLLASALLMGLMGFIALVYVHPWTAPPAVRVAVARFDNETAKPQYGRFADALTDAVREALSVADNGNYRVLGNSALLRVPKARRDLAAIGSSLGARFVVTGRIERSPLGIRVVAELIRLPDQANLRVVSIERNGDDSKRAREALAQAIAGELAPRLNLLAVVPR